MRARSEDGDTFEFERLFLEWEWERESAGSERQTCGDALVGVLRDSGGRLARHPFEARRPALQKGAPSRRLGAHPGAPSRRERWRFPERHLASSFPDQLVTEASRKPQTRDSHSAMVITAVRRIQSSENNGRARPNDSRRDSESLPRVDRYSETQVLDLREPDGAAEDETLHEEIPEVPEAVHILQV